MLRLRAERLGAVPKAAAPARSLVPAPDIRTSQSPRMGQRPPTCKRAAGSMLGVAEPHRDGSDGAYGLADRDSLPYLTGVQVHGVPAIGSRRSALGARYSITWPDVDAFGQIPGTRMLICGSPLVKFEKHDPLDRFDDPACSRRRAPQVLP